MSTGQFAEKGLLGGYPLGSVAPSALAEVARWAGLAGFAGGGRVVAVLGARS